MSCSAHVWRGAPRGRINAIKCRNELGCRPDIRVIARVSQQTDSGYGGGIYFLKDSPHWEINGLSMTWCYTRFLTFFKNKDKSICKESQYLSSSLSIWRVVNLKKKGRWRGGAICLRLYHLLQIYACLIWLCIGSGQAEVERVGNYCCHDCQHKRD